MTRRRQFAALKHAETLLPPKTVREGVRRATLLEIAIESSLKGGYCPHCGVRIGRNVRSHFESCGLGGEDGLRHDDPPDQD
jgi:hypothetical protein